MSNEDFAAQVHKVREVVNYQSGSIVSRIIIKDKGGSVTVFAIDEGQEISEHTVSYNAMIHILEGEADISIAQKVFRVKNGEMIVLPANEPHALSAPVKFKMVLSQIKS